MESKTILGLSLLAFLLISTTWAYQHVPQLTASLSQTTPSIRRTGVMAPQLEAKFLQNKLVLTGTVPDQAMKEKLVSRARELYGEGKFTENLTVSNQIVVPQASWLSSALALLPLIKQTNNEGGFVIQGDTVTVHGTLDNEATKAAVLHSATSAVGPYIKINDGLISKGKKATLPAADLQQKLN